MKSSFFIFSYEGYDWEGVGGRRYLCALVHWRSHLSFDVWGDLWSGDRGQQIIVRPTCRPTGWLLRYELQKSTSISIQKNIVSTRGSSWFHGDGTLQWMSWNVREHSHPFCSLDQRQVSKGSSPEFNNWQLESRRCNVGISISNQCHHAEVRRPHYHHGGLPAAAYSSERIGLPGKTTLYPKSTNLYRRHWNNPHTKPWQPHSSKTNCSENQMLPRWIGKNT